MKSWYKLAVILIILLSIFLRFSNYENRWGLAIDQAHDALVARYALEAHKIPLLGPFSSAGPFQTGGEWYWLIMTGTIIYPFTVITPWIFMTSLCVLFVFLIIKVGEELVDKKFALIVGLLSAISTSQIAQSTNLTNQTPLALFSLLAIWMSLKFVKTKNALYLFLLGFFVSFAATIHLQGIPLFLLAIATLVLTKYFNLKGYLYLLLGLIIPFLPILISDLNHNFFNFRNMAEYYFHGQFKVSLDVLGRNWRNYLGNFWPVSWGYIIGSGLPYGYLFGIGFAWIFIKNILKPKNKEILIILVTFIGIITIVRYTRTPLFDSFLVFLHPFVLIISALVVYEIMKKYEALGLLILIVIASLAIQKDLVLIRSTNVTDINVNEIKKIITTKLPNQKFVVYDLRLADARDSLPLTLYLDVDGKISDDGYKIGIAANKTKVKEKILAESESYTIFDLNSKSKSQLSKDLWASVNPSAIYFYTEDWNTEK